MRPNRKQPRPGWLARTVLHLGILWTAVTAVASAPWGTIATCAVAGGLALAGTALALDRWGTR